ncbi:MAG TPA: hypothetical protein DCY94_02840, partial [Firmicutes bacterium]|nr:hypothetical protein [Bacillota bacterium]
NSKVIKFFIFLAAVLIDISIVNAADLSSTYAPGNCNTTNPYWGMHDEYYINPNITLGVDVPLSSSDLDGIGNNLNANISTRFMYDIISMSVGSDDVLAVTGWAFNTTDERTGSGANAYQNLQFQLVAIDGSGTIPITDVRAGGSYNTKQWLCKRTQADKYTIKGSAGNFNWYKTAGECKVGSKAWGGTGFTVYIDLKNANLKADKSYKLQMQYSGRGSSGWQDVTAAKGIADTVKSYTSRSTDGLDVKITGGTDKVKVHSDGTPVGQNGLVCTLWHDKTPKEMMSIHFSGGEYTYTGAKRTAELNVGDGAMNMYQVQISDNGSPGTSRTAYAAAVWTEFASDGVIKIEIGKSKPITPGDAQVSDAKCEGKDTYEFYYLFLATVEDSYANTMVTSADGAKFNDALILENDLQFTNISV